MNFRVRWGILGTARIGTTKVIPAIAHCEVAEVVAIASRDLAKAGSAAQTLNIAKAYGSYEELLKDPEIDAIYNPLPNDLHVPWSMRALNAGKHVLCEKPIALSAAECRELIGVAHRTGKVCGEAFMVRTHPQWLRARELVQSGALGEVGSILTYFGYFNRDPSNIRNVASMGGGGLMDIGCYSVQISRFLLSREPNRVMALVNRDPGFGVDMLTSGILDFGTTHATFTCSTQLLGYQRVQIIGTKGRLEVAVPFNAPPDQPARLLVDRTGKLDGNGVIEEHMPVVDQYTIQADLFSRAILNGGEPPTPLSDSFRNMAVIDALFRSGDTGAWEIPERE